MSTPSAADEGGIGGSASGASNDEHEPGFRLFVIALSVFSAGAFLGPFITHWAPLSIENWHLFLGTRVAWQAGGALWCGFTAGRLSGGSVKAGLVGMAIFGVIGALLCLNPLLDILIHRGPVHLSGATVIEYRDREYRSGKSGPKLYVRVSLRAEDGAPIEVDNSGYQANRWITAIETCEKRGWNREQPLDLTLLVHMDALIELRCPVAGEVAKPKRRRSPPTNRSVGAPGDHAGAAPL